MRRASLLVGLLGAAATAVMVWGHLHDSVPAFYLGLLAAIAAFGPLAFAAGRDRWPAFALRLCTVVALVAVALLGIELVWAAVAALRNDQNEPPEPVLTYADARAQPEQFRRWWEHAAATLRPSSLVVEDPLGLNPFVLRPNAVVQRLGATIRINSLGFRGREISREKGDVFRIVALGESTTFGYTMLADDEPWPDVLERRIREELGCAAPVQVVNAGVPGWTVDHQIRRLRADIIPLAPDLVISYHGYNGFKYLFKELPSMLVRSAPGEASRPSRLLAALEGHLERRRFLERYESARELAKSVPRIDLASSAYAKHYRMLAKQLLKRHIPLAIATFNMAVNDDSPDEVIRFYEQTFPDVRARMLANRLHTELVLSVPLGGNVIPVDTHEGLDGEYQSLYVDAAHLTQAGRERLARNLLDGLRDALVRHPRLRCGS